MRPVRTLGGASVAPQGQEGRVGAPRSFQWHWEVVARWTPYLALAGWWFMTSTSGLGALGALALLGGIWWLVD